MTYEDFLIHMRGASGVDGPTWGFVASAAQVPGLGAFRAHLLRMGWPRAGARCEVPSGEFALWPSELLELVWLVRYPFFVNELPGRGPSLVGFHDVPVGWLDRVVLPLCEDLRSAALRLDPSGSLLCAYALDQVKEKFGTLRWYGRLDVGDSDGDAVREFVRSAEAAVTIAEALSGQVCVACGSSRDVFYHAHGWFHSSCVPCDCASRGHDADIDGILAEAGLSWWPWPHESQAAAFRLAYDGSSRDFPSRSKLRGRIRVTRLSPDGDVVVDVCEQAEGLGLSCLLGQVREMDDSLAGDVSEVLSRDKVVALARSGR